MVGHMVFVVLFVCLVIPKTFAVVVFYPLIFTLRLRCNLQVEFFLVTEFISTSFPLCLPDLVLTLKEERTREMCWEMGSSRRAWGRRDELEERGVGERWEREQEGRDCVGMSWQRTGQDKERLENWHRRGEGRGGTEKSQSPKADESWQEEV